jgi:hypothetical protein
VIVVRLSFDTQDEILHTHRKAIIIDFLFLIVALCLFLDLSSPNRLSGKSNNGDPQMPIQVSTDSLRAKVLEAAHSGTLAHVFQPPIRAAFHDGFRGVNEAPGDQPALLEAWRAGREFRRRIEMLVARVDSPTYH